MRTYRSAYGPASSLAIAPTSQPGYVSVSIAGGSVAALSNAQARDLAKQLLALAPLEALGGIDGDDYTTKAA